MEMSFCRLGFARPVVLLPKAQMLATTVFPEYKCKGFAKGGQKGREACGEWRGGGINPLHRDQITQFFALHLCWYTCWCVRGRWGCNTSLGMDLCSALLKQM